MAYLFNGKVQETFKHPVSDRTMDDIIDKLITHIKDKNINPYAN